MLAVTAGPGNCAGPPAVTARAGRGPLPTSRIKQPRYQARAPIPAPCCHGIARPSGDGNQPRTCSGDTGDPPRHAGLVRGCRPWS
jgi:hypothetical protein